MTNNLFGWLTPRRLWIPTNRQLLRCGFIRVGSASRGALHFEGSPQGIHRNYQACVAMAEQYQMRAIFEPQKMPNVLSGDVDKTE